VDEPVLLDVGGEVRFGVATRPEGDAGVGVLLLAGVGIPAFGNARTWVACARDLAGEGVVTLRLDCAGFGESGADAHHPLPAEPRTADVTAGLAWLGAEADRLLAVGECHGARSALAAVTDGARADDVLALFPPLWDRDEAGQAPDGDPGFLAAARATAEAGTTCHLLYGAGDLDLPFAEAAAAGPLADLVEGGMLSIEVAEERLHGIASASAVDRVRSAVRGRARRLLAPEVAR
jgi:dienelactone hydrolase